eukprot:5722717-Pyramimonas_sp.AAC.1
MHNVIALAGAFITSKPAPRDTVMEYSYTVRFTRPAPLPTPPRAPRARPHFREAACPRARPAVPPRRPAAAAPRTGRTTPLPHLPTPTSVACCPLPFVPRPPNAKGVSARRDPLYSGACPVPENPMLIVAGVDVSSLVPPAWSLRSELHGDDSVAILYLLTSLLTS